MIPKKAQAKELTEILEKFYRFKKLYQDKNASEDIKKTYDFYMNYIVEESNLDNYQKKELQLLWWEMRDKK